MWTDLRYAIRSLRQARWFTVGAVLTFALGIGVNVAVFAAVDRMLFRKLPYERPQDLVVMRETAADGSQFYGTLPMNYVAEARRLDAVVDASQAGSNGLGFTLAPEPGDETAISLSEVSYNALSVLGVRPYAGRDFTEDDARSKRRVALISYELWQSRFAGRRDLIGQRIWNSREPTEVVGILPPHFINATSYLDPKSDGIFLDFTLFVARDPRERAVPPTIRLKPGVSLAVAQAQVDAMVARLRAGEPAPPPGRLPTVIRLVPLDRVLFGYYTSYLWLVAAASALVFLVACANLSSLMLVRGRSREQQHAVHLALGASRGRLIRGALIEALCLAVAGGAVAALVLVLVRHGLEQVLPAVFSRYSAGLADLRVMLALVGCAVLGAAIAGVAPGLRAGRVDVLAALQQHAGRGSARRIGGRSLLLVEAAVSVLLVAGAAATSRSLIGLLKTDLGFDPRALYTVSVFLPPRPDPGANYEQYVEVERALKAMSGMRMVASANSLPMDGSRPEQLTPEMGRVGSRYRVGAGLLETMGARVVAGRLIASDDVASHAHVGVLNLSALRFIWPGVDPQRAVGRLLQSGGEEPFQIVGIVADIRSSPAAAPQPALFVPVDATKFRFLSYVARTANGRQPSVVAVRRQLKAAGLNPTSIQVGDEDVSISNSLKNDRFRAALFGAFGIAALALAVIGLYSVASFEVSLRRRELGVRIALGATPSGLGQMVMREAVRPVLAGAGIGLIGAYWAGPFLQAFLARTDARDPWTLGIVAAVMVVASAAAAWIPARRAARTDPAAVLRAH